MIKGKRERKHLLILSRLIHCILGEDGKNWVIEQALRLLGELQLIIIILQILLSEDSVDHDNSFVYFLKRIAGNPLTGYNLIDLSYTNAMTLYFIQNISMFLFFCPLFFMLRKSNKLNESVLLAFNTLLLFHSTLAYIGMTDSILKFLNLDISLNQVNYSSNILYIFHFVIGSIFSLFSVRFCYSPIKSEYMVGMQSPNYFLFGMFYKLIVVIVFNTINITIAKWLSWSVLGILLVVRTFYLMRFNFFHQKVMNLFMNLNCFTMALFVAMLVDLIGAQKNFLTFSILIPFIIFAKIAHSSKSNQLIYYASVPVRFLKHPSEFVIKFIATEHILWEGSVFNVIQRKKNILELLRSAIFEDKDEIIFEKTPSSKPIHAQIPFSVTDVEEMGKQ
jgi:hypothetical protein